MCPIYVYICFWVQFELEIVGMLPLFSSRVGSAPSSDIKKDNSLGAVGGDPKPCCNCLGRDTIANAAARVGPAVVNLSVPQGIYFGLLYMFEI